MFGIGEAVTHYSLWNWVLISVIKHDGYYHYVDIYVHGHSLWTFQPRI